MIVDAHMHLSGHGWVRGKYLRGVWGSFVERYNKIRGTNMTPGELGDIMRGYIDPEGDGVVEIMDRAGVDVGVIFTVDWEPITGEPRVTTQEQNKLHAAAAKKHEGRFIALAGLSPTRGNTMEMAKECIEEWGMKGFYLMPAVGFRPDDPICYPLYEKCIDWGVVMNIHCGIEGTPYVDYNHPMYIANVATQYPELKIVLGHGGQRIWGAQAVQIARGNVYLDFGGPPPKVLHPEKWWAEFRDAIDDAGPERLLLGSGFPNPDPLNPEAEMIQAIKHPETQTDIKFTQEELDWYLGRSAQAVYNIKG